MPGQVAHCSRPQPPAISTGKIEVDLSEYRECLKKDRIQLLKSEMSPRAPSLRHVQAKHIGSTMEVEPLLLDLASKDFPSSGRRYQRLGKTPFLFDAADQNASASAATKMLREIQGLVGGDMKSLVEAYRTVIQPTLPVISQDTLGQSKPEDLKAWDPTLLAAVSTLAQLWSSTNESERMQDAINEAELEELAFHLYNQSLNKPSLATIQAGLLLIQLPNIDTKRLNIELVDTAYELGLHLDCSRWSINADEKRLRKRLAWALYMQDKWCSLIHGRPSAISSDNWTVAPLASEDFDRSEDASVNLGRDIFLHMTKLTEILSLILDTFHTSRALEQIHNAGASGTRLILERAKPAQVQLKKWYSTLPAHLKLEANTNNGMSSIGHLYLMYFCAEITLHRTIIRSLARHEGSSSGANAHLEEICRAAAKTRLISVMEFLNRLRPAHWRAFWYFPSRSALALVASFGALLRATAPGQEEAAFYAARLQEYRWTLSVSASHAPFVGQALASLDEAESLLENLPSKPTAREVATARERERSKVTKTEDDEMRDDDNNEDDEDDDDGQGRESDEDEDDIDVDMDDGTGSVASE